MDRVRWPNDQEIGNAVKQTVVYTVVGYNIVEIGPFAKLLILDTIFYPRAPILVSDMEHLCLAFHVRELIICQSYEMNRFDVRVLASLPNQCLRNRIGLLT